MTLKNKKILVGITGGIAVYKICSLVNYFIKDGAEVRVVMTNSAKQFVTPLTFQALTNHPVYDDLWKAKDEHSVEHISLSHWPDIIVIAPATANIIAKVNAGIADDLLTTIILASYDRTNIVFAPAMNTHMWENPITQRNIEALKVYFRYRFVEPRTGMLACRDSGKGKIAENEDIYKLVTAIVLNEKIESKRS